MRPSANPALSLKLPVGRAYLVLGLMLAGLAVLALRALYLQALHHDFLQQKGDARYGRVLEISAHRGMITDRFGEPLAVSTPVESVWASPGDADLSPVDRRRLASLLGMDPRELTARLSETGREFVYLKRHLPPDRAEQVVKLNLPGVFLRSEYRRYYPAGDMMAQLVGFTDIDDRGQEGLELAYQDWLAGDPGARKVVKDRLGRIVESAQNLRDPKPGRDLALAIDQRLQYLAFRELKAAVAQHQAKAGQIVMLDARSGEVLALANLPTYNPNNRANIDQQRARNRAVTDLFEPGSTLKPFTVAAALETHTFRPDSLIQTAPGYLTVGDATIHDPHPTRALTVEQVVQKSSNVGAAKLALALPPEGLWRVLSASGFGSVPHSGFPGEVAGRLRAHHHWRPIEQATMSYGHGISVSLLQLARAYTVFASDGRLMPLSLVRRDEPVAGEPVLSPGTAAAVRRMLELVTQPGGTAVRAQVTGYRVAGKTGTAHKLVGAAYAEDRYVSSFVGFAPVSAPRLVIAVMIDEPAGAEYYGGVVAAPVFSKVMAAALRILGVEPDAPMSQPAPPESAPEVREEV